MRRKRYRHYRISYYKHYRKDSYYRSRSYQRKRAKKFNPQLASQWVEFGIKVILFLTALIQLGNSLGLL